jgi:predicted ATPase/DNA-binding SARP family transcriptional activator
MLEYSILGPLEVRRHGEPVPIGAPKQRALLAVLLLRANQVVPTDRLIDELWSGEPPATAGKILTVYVAKLRKALGPDAVETHQYGYRLRLTPGQLDRDRFEQLVREADGPVPSDVASRLKEALALWQGSPLSEFEYADFARPAIARLEELRLEATERRVEADLQLGRHAALVGELEELVEQNPTREQFLRQLMLALYRSGRQTEALEVFQRTRLRLVEELGIEPGHALRELERSILRHDPDLALFARLDEGETLSGLDNTNVPSPASSFLGREHELDEAGGLLADARLITVTGPGGVGKTRFAIELAFRQLERYPSGVYWVPLADLRDPSLVMEVIGHEVGAKGALDDHIGSRRMLLVLDNLEQVIEVAPQLSRLASACPNLTILVTSRELMRVDGEIELPLPPLVSGEAVALFCERARCAPTPAIRELCQWLDGLPLAVELAAARMSTFTPEQLLQRLGKWLDLFKGRRDADARQQTLRATIEWSYDLISKEERSLFQRFAVFTGGWTLEAAEQVADGKPDLLQSLVEKNLVRNARGRFSMLETIREFAAEKLEQSGEREEMRARHANFFLELATRAQEGIRREEEDASVVFEVDHDNLRAALGFFEQHEPVSMLDLASRCTWFWYVRGHWREGLRWLEAAFARVTQPVERELWARALNNFGALAEKMGDLGTAERSYREALEIRRADHDLEGVSVTLYNLGTIAFEREDMAGARAIYSEALELGRETGNPEDSAWPLAQLGEVALLEEDYATAEPLLLRAQELAKEIGSRYLQSNVENLLGVVALEEGDLVRAGALYRSSLQHAYELEDPDLFTAAIGELALLAAQLNDPEAGAYVLGATEGTRARRGLPLDRLGGRWARAEAAIRDRLDAETYAQQFSAGTEADEDEALAFALTRIIEPAATSVTR